MAIDKFSLIANTFFLDFLSKKLKESEIEAGPMNHEKSDLLKKLRAWRLAAKVGLEAEVVPVMKVAPVAEVVLVLIVVSAIKILLAAGIASEVDVLICENYKIEWKKQSIDCLISDIFLIWYFQLWRKKFEKRKKISNLNTNN